MIATVVNSRTEQMCALSSDWNDGRLVQSHVQVRSEFKKVKAAVKPPPPPPSVMRIVR